MCEKNVQAAQGLLTQLNGQYLKQCEGNAYPNPISGNATPTYFVLTLIYAPPGNQSQVTYGDGSTTGTKSDISISSEGNIELQIETSFLRTDIEFGGGTTSGSSFEIKKTNESILQATSQEDALDHGEDTFLVWTNPQLSMTLTSPTAGSFKIGPAQGADPIIVKLTANQLKNPSLITDSKTVNAVKAFKPSDYQAILNLDPFFFYPNPLVDKGRLVLTNQSVQVLGPDERSGLIVGQGDKLSNETTKAVSSGKNTDNSLTVLGGYEWDTGEKLAVFGGVHITNEEEFSNEKSSGNIQEASYLLQSNTPGTEAAYDVYFDSIFQTFAFIPVLDFSTVGLAGVVKHAPRTKGQMVIVTFKNGTTRKLPVNPTTGEFRVLGQPDSIVKVTYGNRQLTVTPLLLKKRKVVF